jgi:WD40 repeat protein
MWSFIVEQLSQLLARDCHKCSPLVMNIARLHSQAVVAVACERLGQSFFIGIAMLIASSVGRAGDPPITAAAFTPDKTGVVIGSQAGLRLLKWPDLSDVRTLPAELENLHHASFSQDGQRLLIVGGVPGESGTAELLNWPAGTLISRWALHTDVIYEASWSPNGQTFVTSSADGFCNVVDATTGEVRTQFNGHSRAVLTAIFLDEDHCVSGGVDQTNRVWKATDGTLLRTLNNHTQTVNGLTKPSNNTGGPADLLASISEDRTVRLWQPRIGRLVKFAKLPSQPRNIAWSADAGTLNIATNDDMIHRIDVATMKTTAEKKTNVGRIHEFLFDSDRQIMFAAGQHGFEAIKSSDFVLVTPN